MPRRELRLRRRTSFPGCGGRLQGPPLRRRGDIEREHADYATLGAMVLEADLAVDLRKQCAILAETDVEPRAETPAALPHQDRSAADDVAVETLHAEPLR